MERDLPIGKVVEEAEQQRSRHHAAEVPMHRYHHQVCARQPRMT